MITCILCLSCFCEISALCVSWITYAHLLNCKSGFVVYLIECTLYKIQDVGKAEIPLNIRLNNHRKDANGNNPKSITVSIHFKQPGHNFNKYSKFILIEQINNTINTDINTIKMRLKRRKDFWILKLDPPTPEGLNEELNNV